MPKAEEWWIFTFGCGHPHAGHYVKIRGSYSEARKKMVAKYGTRWAFQFALSEWEKVYNNPLRDYPLEAELEVIE